MLADSALETSAGFTEGHIALGFCYYYGERDFDRAMQEFLAAQRGLPNDPETHLAIGADPAASGKMERVEREFRKSGGAESEGDMGAAKSGIELSAPTKLGCCEQDDRSRAETGARVIQPLGGESAVGVIGERYVRGDRPRHESPGRKADVGGDEISLHCFVCGDTHPETESFPRRCRLRRG